MSHFVVYVFGQDYQNSLRPYEQDSDDMDYLVFEDMEQEWRREYEEQTKEVVEVIDDDGNVQYIGKYNRDNNFYEKPEGQVEYINKKHNEIYSTFDEFVEEWRGCEVILIDGEKRYGWYHNPQSKWDGYQVGGRWSGNLTLKDGTKVNQAYKKDINFDDITEETKIKQTNYYNLVKRIVEQSGDLKPKGWSYFRKQHEDGLITIE